MNDPTHSTALYPHDHPTWAIPNKLITAATLLLVVVLVPSATLKAALNESRDSNIPTKKRFLVGSELDFPSYAIITEEGEAGGFSVDLIKAFAEVMGLDIEIRVDLWAEVRSALGNISEEVNDGSRN